MRREKVAGALHRPKGTWLNSNSCPLLVRNAVLALSCSEIGTCQYPLLRSRVENPFSPMESIQEVINPGQRVSILHGSCIELTEVNTETQTTVLLPHHHHWGGPWAVRGTDDIARQHLLDLCHLLPANCGVLPPIGLAERGPMGLNPMLQQWSITQVVVTLAEDVWNSLNNSLSCCCWSGERHSGSGGWQGWVGCEEGEAEAGASARWTTSRTLILCPV